MKKIAIVGLGRFGKTLMRLLDKDFEIKIFHHDSNPKELFTFAEVVFYCVPIDSFESMIKKHRPHIKDHLLIDVLSVKEHPKKIFSKYLKNTEARSLLTHPMFGPDSSKNGFANLPIVMDKNTSSDEEYIFWKTYFSQKGLAIVEMSPSEHDRLAARSQGLTHFIGRLLESMKIQPTKIDTLGTKKLFEVMDQTCHDSWRLFSNLQTYNNYTKQMRIRLGIAYDSLYEKLLPTQVNKSKLVFGIQGGKGSFNEEALHDYLKRHDIKKFMIKYLFTTEKVLKSLHEGKIDFGIFAIQNALGGVVQESTHAMARYRFKIHEEFAIKIAHYLMKRKDVQISEIEEIMAHDQVFKQCKDTLKRKYSNLVQKIGLGDYVDTAKVAWGISHGALPKNTAVLGSRILSEIYSFDIIDENLQDGTENFTTFFIVKR